MYEAETAERQADLQLQSAKAQYKMAEAAVATATAQLAQIDYSHADRGRLERTDLPTGTNPFCRHGGGRGRRCAAQLQAVVWLAVADAQRLKPKQAVSVHACGSSHG